MTKTKAIEILTNMRDSADLIQQADALQMAIDALKTASVTNIYAEGEVTHISHVDTLSV